MKLTPLAKKQLEKIVGPAGVLTDEISVSVYAYDCSVSRTRPEGVLLIKQIEQIAPVLRILHRHNIPFVARGSATNHAGSCVTLKGGVILNLTALNHILEINLQEQFVVVEPGVITADLQGKLAPLGYFYAPDPASQRVCTIGGNVAQNASGARCLKYGGTLDHVLAATFVLPNGEEISCSSELLGPDLMGFLCGSEGTLGILTKLKLRILPRCEHIQTFLITFASLQKAVETVSDLIAHGIVPRCIEAMDKLTLQNVEDFSHAGYPTDAEALLILELEGNGEQVKKETQSVKKICAQHHALQVLPAKTPQERQALWLGRQNAFAAMARLAPNVMVGDGAVPPSKLPHALMRVQQVLQENKIHAGLLFHAGDGNFHPHLLFDERNKLQTAQVTRTLHDILKICVEEGGTLSGEHGIGVEKRALMAYQYDGPTLKAMANIKQALDPQNLANPLKILPYRFAEKARMPLPLFPNVQALQEKLFSYCKNKTPFVVCGQNTHLKTKYQTVLSADTLQNILEIDTDNYTATVQTGVTLERLNAVLKEHRVYSALPSLKGTVGGALCSGMFPGFYAHVLGVEALLPDGSYIRYGGKLMKNAAGYNLARLLAGSQGTLGLVTQITCKIFAHPVPLLCPGAFKEADTNVLWEQLRNMLDPAHLILNNKEEKSHG